MVVLIGEFYRENESHTQQCRISNKYTENESHTQQCRISNKYTLKTYPDM